MTPVWRVQNGDGPSWRFGQAQVTTDTAFQVNKERYDIGSTYYLLFISTQDSNTKTGAGENLAIAYIDDITYTKGACPHVRMQDVCTFENPDLCGWHAEGLETETWVRTSTKDELCQDCPPDDHTYHTNQGHYMAVRSEPGEETKSGFGC